MREQQKAVITLCDFAIWATVGCLFFVGIFSPYFKDLDCSYYIASLECLNDCDEASRFFAYALCIEATGNASVCDLAKNRKAYI